jgi:hypothetical protein
MLKVHKNPMFPPGASLQPSPPPKHPNDITLQVIHPEDAFNRRLQILRAGMCLVGVAVVGVVSWAIYTITSSSSSSSL